MLPDRVSNPGPLTYESGALPIALRGPANAHPRRAVVSYWQKYVHLELFNHLRGISLPNINVVRLTDCLDLAIAVYHRLKQQNNNNKLKILNMWEWN